MDKAHTAGGKIVVLGNGVSRLMFDVARIPHTRIGCNWAARELKLDALCTVDYLAYGALRGGHRTHFHTPMKGSLSIELNGTHWQDAPKNVGLCSGRLATLVAARYYNATEIYLLGVDFMSHDPERINNVYATQGHRSGRTQSVFDEWNKLMNHIPQETKIYCVSPLDVAPLYSVPRLAALTNTTEIRAALWPQDAPISKEQAHFITPEIL